MTLNKFTEAVRRLLESELRCPNCGAENVPGKRIRRIELQEDGLAVCRVCRRDWRPDLRMEKA